MYAVWNVARLYVRRPFAGGLKVEQISSAPPDSIDKNGHLTSQKTGVAGLLRSVNLFVIVCIL